MTKAGLERFVDAQRDTYQHALAELREGRKRSHWMWFIFPQMRGLGLSDEATFYGIASLDEAKTYLAHPKLGRRLDEVTREVLQIRGRTPRQIFGSPDDLKFRSSMTLFATAAGTGSIYQDALGALCGNSSCHRTISLLGITKDTA